MKPDNRSPSSNCPAIPTSQKGQKKLRESTAMVHSGELAEIYDRATPLENAISSTALSLWEFFHANGYMILRSEWSGISIHAALCDYLGWVYAFYGRDDDPLYIGETGRNFTVRFQEHSNQDQDWWPDWTRVKVLPCPDKSMRKVFESLIGLGGGYQANRMQPAGNDNILDEVILSLLVLGNDTNTPPTFPTKVVFD